MKSKSYLNVVWSQVGLPPPPLLLLLLSPPREPLGTFLPPLLPSLALHHNLQYFAFLQRQHFVELPLLLFQTPTQHYRATFRTIAPQKNITYCWHIVRSHLGARAPAGRVGHAVHTNMGRTVADMGGGCWYVSAAGWPVSYSQMKPNDGRQH